MQRVEMRMKAGKTAIAWMISCVLTSSSWSAAQDTQPIFKRYNLRCLAPLLESLDAEEPKTLEEALLAGPAGSSAALGQVRGDGMERAFQ